MVFAADFVALCLKQAGDRYVFGHEVKLTDEDPDTFDCSELVQWAGARLGVRPKIPDGSWLQARHLKRRGMLCSVKEGIETQGALLFRFKGDPFEGRKRPKSAHVAVSLGNGNTIEARGSRWGVGEFSAVRRRGWTHAGLIPGIVYDAPPSSPKPAQVADPEPDAVIPDWPGRLITQPPIMAGDDVRLWQGRAQENGWQLEVDGLYGDESEGVCRALQAREGLAVDGIVGPDTWRATWAGKPKA